MKEKESDEAKKLKADIEAIKNSTPMFDSRMAHTVEEASIFVMPDGPDRTKLDVRKKEFRDLPVFRRGNPGNPGDLVPRRFIEVLSPSAPKPFESGSGRREFAEALFHEAKGLTAHADRGVRRLVEPFWTLACVQNAPVTPGVRRSTSRTLNCSSGWLYRDFQ